MPKEITPEEAYDKCTADGSFIFNLEPDLDRAKSMLEIAKEQSEAARSLAQKKFWNSTYKMHYEVLHLLVETFLLCDKVKAKTHLCVFAYLCEKYPALELDWNFFEKVRTKRNGITYYGIPVDDKDWKGVELQFTLYIKKLKEEIKKKLG